MYLCLLVFCQFLHLKHTAEAYLLVNRGAGVTAVMVSQKKVNLTILDSGQEEVVSASGFRVLKAALFHQPSATALLTSVELLEVLV